jgi:hypothetical protein
MFLLPRKESMRLLWQLISIFVSLFHKFIPMTTMTLQVPDFLEADHQDTVRFIAAKLYESGKLSLGQAAEMAGMKKWVFAEILIQYDVHYLDQSVMDDLHSFDLYAGK